MDAIQIKTIVFSVISSLASVCGIGWLVKKSISVKIENSIRSSYDVKIENLKSELNISHSVLANSLATQSEGLKATFEKRLEAIDNLWSNILAIETYTLPLHFDNYITIEETEQINKNKIDSKSDNTIRESLERINMHKYAEFMIAENTELEKKRPYIGEDIWLLRFYYNLFIGRILLDYSTKYNDGVNLTHWTKDSYLMKVLKSALTEDELKTILNARFGTIQSCIDIFKQKILHEISNLTSGVLVGNTNIKNAVKLNNMLSELKKQEFTGY